MAADVPTVTSADLAHGVGDLGLAGQAVCVHSSLRSFGRVQGGAREVVDAFLRLGCTVVVPTFSYGFSVPPPPELRPSQNGWQYDVFRDPPPEWVAPTAPTASRSTARIWAPSPLRS